MTGLTGVESGDAPGTSGWTDDRWLDHRVLMANLAELSEREPDAERAVIDLLTAADGGRSGFYHSEYQAAVAWVAEVESHWAGIDPAEGWSGDGW